MLCAAVAMLGAGVLGGCESDKARPYQLEFVVDESVKTPGIIHAGVAKNQQEIDALKDKPVKEYFAKHDPPELRKNGYWVVRPDELTKSDRKATLEPSVWTSPKTLAGSPETAWLPDARAMFIFVDLPTLSGGTRPLMLNLSPKMWPKDTKNIKIRIMENGPQIESPQPVSKPRVSAWD